METQVQTLEQEVEMWLEELSATAEANAKELSAELNQKVIPMIFPIEDLKDAAIAYVRSPNLNEFFNLFRVWAENQANGLKMFAQAHLIRVHNEIAISDARFIDQQGNYSNDDEELNRGLIMRLQSELVKFKKDEFKKK